MKRCLIIGLLAFIWSGIYSQSIATPEHRKEKTAFQVAAPWSEAYDVRSDIAIVYGINDAGGQFEERVNGWRTKGYQVHFMTGIAWGSTRIIFGAVRR
ncbi:hypothetical protein LWM68_10915 [Niabella sp. W65]|nr:hypothetical protein [Niabella sp. W65]MCH7363229.1 hypothetical protein [Niabella sp. W65]